MDDSPNLEHVVKNYGAVAGFLIAMVGTAWGVFRRFGIRFMSTSILDTRLCELRDTVDAIREDNQVFAEGMLEMRTDQKWMLKRQDEHDARLTALEQR